MSSRRIALALGGGGARGYAHIGVIDEVLARGHTIAGVSGTSMGALVGGLYCAGAMEDFRTWAVGLNQRDVWGLVDPSFGGGGPIRAGKVLDVVRKMLGERDIESLDLPFTAVATDILSGRSVWFQRGPLDIALRASIAIPGVIAPVPLDGRLLADGGILDPLPVGPIAAVAADLTIGVSLGSEDPPTADEGNPDAPHPVAEWFAKVRATTTQFWDTEARTVVRRFGASGGVNPEPPQPDPIDLPPDPATHPRGTEPKMSSFDVLNRSLEIMQGAISRYQLAINPPDILIKIPRSTARATDFHRAAALIELGREFARGALDAHPLTANP